MLPVGKTMGLEMTPLAQHNNHIKSKDWTTDLGLLVSSEAGSLPLPLEPGNVGLDNRKLPTQSSSWTRKKRLKDSLALLCSLIPFQGELYSEASISATSSGIPHF